MRPLRVSPLDGAISTSAPRSFSRDFYSRSLFLRKYECWGKKRCVSQNLARLAPDHQKDTGYQARGYTSRSGCSLGSGKSREGQTNGFGKWWFCR